MYKFRLGLGIAAEFDIGTACLIIQAVRAGRNLTVLALRREPYFDIIGLGRRKAHIARAKLHHMVRQLQNAQNIFSSIHHGFEFVPARFRLNEFNQLDLVELMLADKTAGVAAGTACFSTEASRVSAVVFRQFVAIEDFITMVVRGRHFSRRHQIIVHAFQLEHIFGKLRQLARARHAVLVGNVRCQHFRIAMLRGMKVHHKVDAGTFQAGAQTLVEHKAGTGNFSGTVSIENVQIRTDIPVCLRLEGELFRRAPFAHFRIFRIVLADGHISLGHIGDVQQDVPQLFLDFFELGIQSRNLFAYSTHFGNLVIRIFLVLLHLTDDLGNLIAFSLQSLRLLEQAAALLFERGKIIQIQRIMTVGQHLPYFIEMLTDKFNV